MPNIGTLITQVYTSNSHLPIKDATVSIIKRRRVGQPELLAVRVTDQNGKTTPVAIETPPVEESYSPGGVPYALCDVWVEHMNYQVVEIQNVQIFPGVESIQDVQVTPLGRNQNQHIGVDVIDISPQDL